MHTCVCARVSPFCNHCNRRLQKRFTLGVKVKLFQINELNDKCLNRVYKVNVAVAHVVGEKLMWCNGPVSMTNAMYGDDRGGAGGRLHLPFLVLKP